MIKDYKKLKRLFADDPEMLDKIEKREQVDLLREVAGREFSMKGVQLIKLKGERGYTPQKGIDYLTDEELGQIMEQSTPKKGVHYFTNEDIQQIKNGLKDELRPIKGIDYVDGKNADENKIIKEISKHIPTAEEIRAGIEMPQIDEDKLIAKILLQIKFPDTETFTIADVVKEIKKKKLLELRDIKGARLDMNDQRWHGSGSGGTGAVTSVNGKVGVVVLTTADIADTLNKRYVTDADLVNLSNLSGVNSGDQLIFKTFAVSGQSDVVADTTADTLTLVAGTGITITTNALTDAITINASGAAGLNKETPVGAIDDSNVTFTVANTPFYISVNGLIYNVGDGLFSSYVAGTITLTSPVGTGGFIKSYYQ